MGKCRSLADFGLYVHGWSRTGLMGAVTPMLSRTGTFERIWTGKGRKIWVDE